MDPQQRRNRKTAMTVFTVVAAMVALSFASVPLYRLFCQVTGYGGTTQVSQALPEKILDREVTVRFNTDVSPELPWDFKPELKQVRLRIGEEGVIAFLAHNQTAQPLTGTAIYNVTPLKAGKYFHKMQCFCFGEQLLEPGQSVSMPVVFYVDPAFDEDPNMEDVTSITLSYSFFQAESQALERALDAFYNADSAPLVQ